MGYETAAVETARNDLQVELLKIIRSYCPSDGLHPSPVPGVYCLKFSKTEQPAKRRWRACLGLVIQGGKKIVLGREIYRLEAGHYTATPVELPVVSSVVAASPGKPFLALLIDLDPPLLTEVSAQIDGETPKESDKALRAVFVGKANDVMLAAAVRLAKLFQNPDDAPVLRPLIVKEILYHLLKGPEGAAIRKFVRSGSKMHKISRAIHALASEFSKEADLPALAKTANMSRSAFFKYFKEVAAMSPIQYRKRLRLHEARRLMIEQGETAEASAFKVGYNSASQFSREYSRMFGDSPLRDAVKVKEAGNLVRQM
ncbi:MAG TPA: AraC family transcriptional regulator [Candidatus Methylacidiphilales bacterium]|jgi:AraC-like DNA-binding protein|nr:AraC family transcriptional regulator [Candidatus Methylacidiphilales bacterium]